MILNSKSVRMNLRRALTASIVSSCLGLGAAIVHAGDSDPGYAPTKTWVEYGDLNLATTQGIERLYERIAQAAEGVCGRPERSLASVQHVRLCTRKAIARAVADVANPELTALFAARTHAPVHGAQVASR